LRLEARYYPDGWLGALCGNNLVYDFSVPAKQTDSFTGLLNGLARYDRTATDPVSAGGGNDDHVTTSHVITASHERAVDVTRWRRSDIDVWLDTNDLKHLKDWFVM